MRRSRLTLAGLTLLVAVVAFGVAGAEGNIHGALHQVLFAAIGGGVFIVAGVVAIRATATELYEVLGSRAGLGQAGILRWLVMIVGYVIILFAALGLFAVPLGHLLVGGALTGVIVGIAAQQSLGNVFAGVVLLLAHPFSVGDAIMIRSGSMGGPLSGRVSGMGVTYVTLLTDDGPISLPNSAVLAAAVGPIPGSQQSRSRRYDLSGQQTAAAMLERLTHGEHPRARTGSTTADGVSEQTGLGETS